MKLWQNYVIVCHWSTLHTMYSNYIPSNVSKDITLKKYRCMLIILLCYFLSSVDTYNIHFVQCTLYNVRTSISINVFTTKQLVLWIMSMDYSLILNCVLSHVLIVLVQAHWKPRELERLKLLHIAVGNGAKNKFRSCWQWREWNFLGLLFSFTNSRYELSPPLAVALEASHQRCQERDDACSVHTLKKTERGDQCQYTTFFLSLRRDEISWPRWQLGPF